MSEYGKYEEEKLEACKNHKEKRMG